MVFLAVVLLYYNIYTFKIIHRVSSGPLRNRHQDWTSCERHLLWELPVKDRGGGSGKGGESLQTVTRGGHWEQGEKLRTIRYEESQTARFGQGNWRECLTQTVHQRIERGGVFRQL